MSSPATPDSPESSPGRTRASSSGFWLRLLVGGLLPLVVAVACQAGYTVLNQRRAMDRSLNDKAISLARLMVNAAGPSVAFDDIKAVNEALAYVSEEPDFAFVEALDPSGRVLARHGERPSLTEQGAGPLIESTAPIVTGGKTIGTIRLALRTARVHQQVRAMSVKAALISLAGIAVAVFVVLRLARAIARRNRDMAVLLDSAEQGFLSVNEHGVLAEERSAAARSWLGEHTPGQHLWEAVAKVDPTTATWIRLGWESLREGFLPVEVCLDQLPRRLKLGGRILRLDVRPQMEGERLKQALVVLSDVTQEMRREEAEAMGRDLLRVLEKVSQDKNGFTEFLEDAEDLVLRIAHGLGQAQEARASESFLRDLHTLKGNAAMFGLHSLSERCHLLEDQLASGEAEAATSAGQALLSVWHETRSKLGKLLGARRQDLLELHQADLEDLESRLAAGAQREELLRLIAAWRDEALEVRLQRSAQHAKEMASRLGRGAIEVEVDAGTVRLERDRWLPFWRVFGHVLRNAIDHGLEFPSERLAAGKPAHGRLTLRAVRQEGSVTIEVGDDGRGIDWKAVAEKAAHRGLPHASHEDLVEALFSDGLSTKETTSHTSGRGVGLAAVKAASHALGATIEVRTHLVQGTVFRFKCPAGIQAVEEVLAPDILEGEIYPRRSQAS